MLLYYFIIFVDVSYWLLVISYYTKQGLQRHRGLTKAQGPLFTQVRTGAIGRRDSLSSVPWNSRHRVAARIYQARLEHLPSFRLAEAFMVACRASLLTSRLYHNKGLRFSVLARLLVPRKHLTHGLDMLFITALISAHHAVGH